MPRHLLRPPGNAAHVHCRRKSKSIKGVRPLVLGHPGFPSPWQVLSEDRKDLGEPECHFILALPGREGISDRNAGDVFHPRAARLGELFHVMDFLPGALPPAAALRRHILDHE
jgi:hypothetical protein